MLRDPQVLVQEIPGDLAGGDDGPRGPVEPAGGEIVVHPGGEMPGAHQVRTASQAAPGQGADPGIQGTVGIQDVDFLLPEQAPQSPPGPQVAEEAATGQGARGKPRPWARRYNSPRGSPARSRRWPRRCMASASARMRRSWPPQPREDSVWHPVRGPPQEKIPHPAVKFDPGVGTVHCRHHPGQPQPQRPQAAIEVGMIEVGMEDVRSPGFEPAPHHARDPPEGSPFNIQPQADHLIAPGRSSWPTGPGGPRVATETANRWGSRPWTMANLHQVFRPPHRHRRRRWSTLRRRAGKAGGAGDCPPGADFASATRL